MASAFSIYNTGGSLVKEIMGNPEIQIKVSDLQPGIYLIRINRDNSKSGLDKSHDSAE